jgi:tripeptidyl-peptidase I
VCNISFTTPTCLRTLYGTIDYKPQAAKKNKLGITNYLNETSNRPDIQKALQAFRPEAVAAADEFKIVKIDNPIDVQTPTLTPEQLDAGLNIEGVLDAELSLSIAWPTQLVSWLTGGSPPFIPDLSTPTNTNEPYLAWLNFVLAEKDLPQVISTSYGEDVSDFASSFLPRANPYRHRRNKLFQSRTREELVPVLPNLALVVSPSFSLPATAGLAQTARAFPTRIPRRLSSFRLSRPAALGSQP